MRIPEQRYREIVQARTRAALDAAMCVRDGWESLLWTAAVHPGQQDAVNMALMAYQAPGELLGSVGEWEVRGRRVVPGAQVRALIYAGVPGQRAIQVREWVAPEVPRPVITGGVCVALYDLGQTEAAPGAVEVAPEAIVPMLLLAPERIEAAGRELLREMGAAAPGAEGAAGVLSALGREVFARHVGAGPLPLDREGEAESVAYLAGLMLGAPGLTLPPLPRVEYGTAEVLYGPARSVLTDVIQQGRSLALRVYRQS
ncbi:hypothetical protein ACFY1V_31855 [Streptomyces sp. NPDC001255]|uniref:hypothetical protein n=1 Tax=Streptomyces sp. NPDC001255 TaxID=3364550 RepID=UPI0036ABB16B